LLTPSKSVILNIGHGTQRDQITIEKGHIWMLTKKMYRTISTNHSHFLTHKSRSFPEFTELAAIQSEITEANDDSYFSFSVSCPG